MSVARGLVRMVTAGLSDEILMLSDPALWLPVEAEDHETHQLEGQPLRQSARKPVIGGWWKVELVVVTGILYGPPFFIGSCPGQSKLEGDGQDTRW